MRHETPSARDPTINTHLQDTLKTIALISCVVSTLLIPVVALTSYHRTGLWTAVIFSALSWASLTLVHTGRMRYVAHLFIFSVLGVGSLGVIASGSVRSSVVFLLAGGVAAAGVFFGRRALVAATVYSVTVLGVLTWAEVAGLLHKPSFEVGLSVWATQSTCIVMIGIVVYYSRIRALQAYRLQLEELSRRKATEIERDRSLERSARIFRTSPNPMVVQSAHDGSIVDVNPAFERTYRYSRNEVLGRQDDFLWTQPQLRATYLEKLFSQRLVTQFPVTGLRSDGSCFDALISSEMGNDPDDKLIITSISDISAQSEALEKLRRSEERFSKAFHFSPLHMSITRYSDGQLIDVNKVAKGVQPDGFQGEPTIAREFWPSALSRAEFVRSLRLEGRLHGYETQLCRPDGSLMEARVWAELIELDGETCVLACTMNISEEKRREALLVNMARGMSAQPGESLFMALLKHMAHALSAHNAFVAEIDESEQLQTLAVWRNGAPGANFTQPLASVATVPPEARQYAESALAGLATEHNQLPPAWTREQSRTDWPLLDDQGRVIGLLSVEWTQPVPITAESRALISIFASRANAELLRHRQEEEVRRLNATLEDRVRIRTSELEQVNAELDSFAYSVSHDLKSPLRAIDGFTHILLESFDDRSTEDERDAMKRILAATHRMSNLIKDLLALARISQSTLSIAEVDLSAMARGILGQVALSMPDRPRELRIEPGMVCHCDPNLARIALTNLLHNAFKYTRDQPHPVIELGRKPGPGGTAVFFVRDNGAGFDMAHADKLFKPFQRLHMPREFEGTGIGLATVRRIVERHGGQIQGNARRGEGATFQFTFDAMAQIIRPPQAVTT